jgi:hypothetical protein
MPRLSLYRSHKSNDYRFLDRTISEQYTVGGLDILVHRYLGPAVKPPGGTGDATQPAYTHSDPLFIEDVLFLENRDRKYDPDVYQMRGVYNVQDLDFDLSQFGLFIAGDTLYITFHYNDMIDTIGRKLMSGDVLELPNLKDYHPLNAAIPKALPKFYVIQDAAFASEGFSQTWLPHLWRIKAIPLVGSQEYKDILDQLIDEDDPDAGSLADYLTTHSKDLAINNAIIAQAEVEVPLSGYDTDKLYVLPTDPETLRPVNPDNHTPWSDGWTVGYLTGDGIPPNGHPVTAGVAFPLNPVDGDFSLRLDYQPNRLFRFNGVHWKRIEDNVRTDLTNGPLNETQRSRFVNNDAQVQTTDRGLIPSRQTLSKLLRPEADN